MMPEWNQLDLSSAMPQQQESTKKKTLKSSSRSFWFSTGLQRRLGVLFFCRKSTRRARAAHAQNE